MPLAAITVVPEIVPSTSRAAPGVTVPIPSLLFVSSQKKFALSWLTTPPAPAKRREPCVIVLKVTAPSNVAAPSTLKAPEEASVVA